MAHTRGPKTPINQTQQPTKNPQLTAAEHFLSIRNFTDSITHATRAQQSDPTHPSPPRLLSIATVLSTPHISPTRPNYYSILNLPAFEPNILKIKNSFKNLTNELNPNTNKFPFSTEAFELVLKAWAVLSDPFEKHKFDNEMRGGSGDATFWTVCPYCYYVFEFERVYEGCCLRCSNEVCRKGFTSVAIGTPPREVIEEGKYKCGGFLPVSGNEWVPVVIGENGVGKGEFVVDDENEGNGNGKRAKTGGENEEKENKESVFSLDGIEFDWEECLDIIGGETGESGIECYDGKDDFFAGLDGLED